MGAEIPILGLLAPWSSMTKRTQTRILFHPGRQWGEVCSAGTQGSNSACTHPPSILLALSFVQNSASTRSVPCNWMSANITSPLWPSQNSYLYSAFPHVCTYCKGEANPKHSFLVKACCREDSKHTRKTGLRTGSMLRHYGNIRHNASLQWSRHAGKACPGQQPGSAAFSLFAVCRGFRRKPPAQGPPQNHPIPAWCGYEQSTYSCAYSRVHAGLCSAASWHMWDSELHLQKEK